MKRKSTKSEPLYGGDNDAANMALSVELLRANRGRMKITIEIVKRVKYADGAFCQDCDVFFTNEKYPFWYWTKSRGLHERVCGHKMQLFKFKTEDE